MPYVIFYYVIMLCVFRSNHHCSWKFYKFHRKAPVLECFSLKLYKDICSAWIKLDLYSLRKWCNLQVNFFFFFNLYLRRTKCSVYLTNLLFLLSKKAATEVWLAKQLSGLVIIYLIYYLTSSSSFSKITGRVNW